MRISKLYLVVCAATLCGGVAAARAKDTPAQAAARAALEQQMRQMNAQPESTNTQTSVPATSEQSGQAAKPAPATSPPVQKPATTVAPAPAEAQSTKSAPAAAGSSGGLFAPVPPPSGNNQIAMPSETIVERHRGPNANYPGKVLGLNPIQPPPLPITSQQKAQLRALLQRYESNAITPEQYQAQRAKILAEH